MIVPMGKKVKGTEKTTKRKSTSCTPQAVF